MNSPSLEENPVQGLDVSHHQKVIDWKLVGKSDFQFVYIKATEGGDFKDKRFSTNWHQAKRAGFVVGAYHFFTLCRPGKQQAENFISSVPVEKVMLPPAIDLEFGGNCKSRPSQSELLKQVYDFSTKIEEHYRRKPIFYVTYDFYKTYLLGHLRGHEVWVRDIFQRPDLPSGPKWKLWQFANRGRVEGIKTYVDLNAFNGSRTAFENWIQPEKGL